MYSMIALSLVHRYKHTKWMYIILFYTVALYNAAETPTLHRALIPSAM